MWPFRSKKEKPFENKIALYSEIPENERFLDDLDAIKGPRESFATDFLEDPDRPGVAIRHQAEYDQNKSSWDLVAILRVGPESGLEPGSRRETLAKTDSFFNTLHWCSTLQAAMENSADKTASPNSPKEDWQDFKHWRAVAAEAGQACDISGVVHPCANGKPLTDGHFTDAQLTIAKKTKVLELETVLHPVHVPQKSWLDPICDFFSSEASGTECRSSPSTEKYRKPAESFDPRDLKKTFNALSNGLVSMERESSAGLDVRREIPKKADHANGWPPR